MTLLFHLFMVIITGGLWLIIWALIEIMQSKSAGGLHETDKENNNEK